MNPISNQDKNRPKIRNIRRSKAEGWPDLLGPVFTAWWVQQASDHIPNPHSVHSHHCGPRMSGFLELSGTQGVWGMSQACTWGGSWPWATRQVISDTHRGALPSANPWVQSRVPVRRPGRLWRESASCLPGRVCMCACVYVTITCPSWDADASFQC